jgi:hypothetical protein
MLVMSPAMAARIARESLKAQRRKLKAEREALVNALVMLLRDAREAGAPSWFTLEGPAVAVIRAQLCLERWPWPAGDWAARDVVGEALARVGAERPSWQEGQPEWTDGGAIRVERTGCAECGKPLPEGHKLFCSRRCGQAARARRYWRDRAEERNLARRLQRRADA